MSIVISVENISKSYHLGQIGTGTFANDLKVWSAKLIGKPNPLDQIGQEDHGNRDGEVIWALKDVSLTVDQGEVLGIIGRNGAGKSTLLKILSRVTAPTSGEVKVKGRIASLLEVGTGFHPELTGRENIYLNGAILGMSKDEIRRKFDEIVDFSELEKFIDTPVRRYSSGMYVRLAFAVAAHLEPEILLVDEVLAVGDAQFQKKCLGKMGDVAHEGRTVFFVSHNMSAVQRLCNQSLLLEAGKLTLRDETAKVVTLYITHNSSASTAGKWIDLTRSNRIGSGEARFYRACYFRPFKDQIFQPLSGEPLDFLLEISSDTPRSVGSLAVTIYDNHGLKLINADTLRLGRIIQLQSGTNQIHLRIEKLYLNEGIFSVGLWLANLTNCVDHVEGAFCIQVQSNEAHSYGVKPSNDGLVACDFNIIEPSFVLDVTS